MAPDSEHGSVATAPEPGRKGRLSRLFSSGATDRASVEDQARGELEAALGSRAGAQAPPPPPPVPAADETDELRQDLMAPTPPTADEQQWISDEEIATFPGMFGRRPAPLARPHFHELELE